MAYADRQMSGNRLTALIIVALIHLVVGYMLVTGLAYSAVQNVIKHVTTVDVKEPDKKPPPPPPPPKNAPPPPIVAPPPPINVAVAPPAVQTVVTPPPPAPIVPAFTPPPAPVAPAPSKARAVGDARDRASWVGQIQDSASADLVREAKSGSVGVSISVGPNGRVTGCSVTSSSGTPGLDKLACSGIVRYGRYNPALDEAGNPTSGTKSEHFRFNFSDADQ